jgi:uroporphyrin-III C-methyltransferase
VALVGAGPGDPGLITVAGLERVREADVIVYDRLVNPRLLDHACAEAELIDVGKIPGESHDQVAINRLLIEKARAGQRVVRLKGGDPFVFGRGGEEALALVAAAVPFRIVPGITAGIGGLAYAGIPVTHRDTNHAVTFVTGHGVTGDVPDGLDWAALAKGAPVLVFYMALKHLGTIAQNLVDGGRSAQEPAAIVCRATTAQQTVLETSLGEAAGAARNAGLEPPAIFVVGEIVKLRAGLDWLAGGALDPDPLRIKRRRDTG